MDKKQDKKNEILNREMTRIYKRDGKIAVSVVKKEAEPEDAPLHNFLEWDNDKAADEHRNTQIREMIRKAVIIVDERPERFVHIPVYKVDEDGSKEGYYKPTPIVVENMDEFTYALKEAQQKLAAAQRAVKDLETAVKRKRGDAPEDTTSYLLAVMKSLEAANAALEKCA